MTADVISTYAGLLYALRSLPPPAEGRIRVFRGQNHEYPTMTPTALRTTPYCPKTRLWFVKTLETFDSFEISDLERLTNLAKDGAMLQAGGTLSGMEFLRITTG